MKSLKHLAHHPLFSGSAIMVGGSMAANGVNYIYHFIMGRTLGVADYGTLAALYSLLYLLSIVPISSSLAIVKFVSSADTPKKVSEIYLGIKQSVTRLSTIFSIILLVLSPFIASFLHIEDFFSVVLIVPIFWFTLITLINQASLQGLMNFMGVVMPNFIASVAKLVIGLTLVLLGFSVGGAMLGVFIGAILAFISSKFLIQKKILISGQGKLNQRTFYKYAIPVLLQSLAFTSFFSTDLLLVKHFFSEQDAGLYAALSIIGKIIFFAAQPITGVMFPIISTRHSRGEHYTKVLLVSLTYTLAICFSALAVFLFFPKLALFLYGDQYSSAADNLVWMGVFVSIYTIANLFTNFYLSIGKTKIVLLPIITAIAQIALISVFHSTLREVIQVSAVLMLGLTLSLFGYFLYNSGKLKYAKT